jgi:hypothetical protein
MFFLLPSKKVNNRVQISYISFKVMEVLTRRGGTKKFKDQIDIPQEKHQIPHLTRQALFLSITLIIIR